MLDALHADASRATGLMTRGAAISIALLALIALVLIMLLGRYGIAANSPGSGASRCKTPRSFPGPCQ